MTYLSRQTPQPLSICIPIRIPSLVLSKTNHLNHNCAEAMTFAFSIKMNLSMKQTVLKAENPRCWEFAIGEIQVTFTQSLPATWELSPGTNLQIDRLMDCRRH